MKLLAVQTISKAFFRYTGPVERALGGREETVIFLSLRGVGGEKEQNKSGLVRAPTSKQKQRAWGRSGGAYESKKVVLGGVVPSGAWWCGRYGCGGDG